MNQLIKDYECLQDNDPLTAYSIMKRASALLATYETREVELDKRLNVVKTLAGSIEADVILAAGGSISKGERVAQSDKSVVKAWNAYYKAKLLHGKITANIKYLWRIYYDCQAVWKQAGQVKRRETNG